MNARRVIVPLKFSNGDLIRNLDGLKRKIAESPGEIISKIAGGELERFFYGIAKDEIRDKIKGMRESGSSAADILKEIANVLNVEVKSPATMVNNIVNQADDLKTKLESADCICEFPRGSWASDTPILINSVKYVKAAGSSATQFSINEMVIDIKEAEPLQISGLTLKKIGDEEGTLRIINGNLILKDICFDGVKLELSNQSVVKLENCRFISLSSAIFINDEAVLEIAKDIAFDKVEIQAYVGLVDKMTAIKNISDLGAKLSYLIAQQQEIKLPEKIHQIEQKEKAMAKMLYYDELSDIFWSLNANLAVRTIRWDDANEFIAKLNSDKYLGYTNWRLPTREEFELFINSISQMILPKHEAAWPDTNPMNMVLNELGIFNVVMEGFYWTNSPTTYDSESVCVASIYGQNVYSWFKGDRGSVWPVRGESA